MRRFRTLAELVLFFDGVFGAFEFVCPSPLRSDNYVAVQRTLSLHLSISTRPIYVLFGPKICCVVNDLTPDVIALTKGKYLVYEVHSSEKSLIVNTL